MITGLSGWNYLSLIPHNFFVPNFTNHDFGLAANLLFQTTLKNRESAENQHCILILHHVELTLKTQWNQRN